MKRIIYVLGATCSGKSTLVEEAAKFADHIGIVQVGKEFRRRYPPEHFAGKGAMDYTEKETENIFREQLVAGLDAGKTIMLVDGNPRTADQLRWLGCYGREFATQEFWWVRASDDTVEKWVRERCKTQADLELSQQRTTNDCVQLYPLLHHLLFCGYALHPVRMTTHFLYEALFREQGLDKIDPATGAGA